MNPEPNVKDCLELVNGIAPLELAEPWDNCGLQAGHPDWPVRRMAVALDVTPEVLTAARKWNADLLITHHPLTISPLKQIDFSRMPGKAVAFCARHRISLIALHTNLDKVKGGLNDCLADRLGFSVIKPLDPSGVSPSSAGAAAGSPVMDGIGRVCRLPSPMTLKALGDHARKVLGLKTIRRVGRDDQLIDTLALCTGSGESLLPRVLSSGAQAYLTGDMKYHGAREAEFMGLGLIDIGHFSSEHIAVDLLVEQLTEAAQKRCYPTEIRGFHIESDPFIVEGDLT